MGEVSEGIYLGNGGNKFALWASIADVTDRFGSTENGFDRERLKTALIGLGGDLRDDRTGSLTVVKRFIDGVEPKERLDAIDFLLDWAENFENKRMVADEDALRIEQKAGDGGGEGNLAIANTTAAINAMAAITVIAIALVTVLVNGEDYIDTNDDPWVDDDDDGSLSDSDYV